MTNKTIKLPAAIVKAACLFQAKDDVRQYITGIYLDKKGHAVATNGHALIKIDYKPLQDLKESLIIRTNGTKLPKKAKELEFVFFDDDSGVVRMTNGHGTRMDDVRSFSVITGKFPDYERVIPKGDLIPVDEIGINPNYMNVVSIAQSELGGKFQCIKIELRGKSAATLMRLTTLEYPALAIIMPMGF